jgi:hypothetical protein
MDVLIAASEHALFPFSLESLDSKDSFSNCVLLMIVYSTNNTSSKNKKLFIATCDITLLIHVINKKILNIIDVCI